MKNIFLILALIISINLNAQKELTFFNSLGAAKMPFRFGLEKENLTGLKIQTGLEKKLFKDFGAGVITNFYHLSKIETPSALELIYTENTLKWGYREPFFQQNTHISYLVATLHIFWSKQFGSIFTINSKYGISFIKGNESRTRLSSEGNLLPTITGYSKNGKAEIATIYGSLSLLANLSSKIDLGIQGDYQNILEYWGGSLLLQIKL